MPIVSDECYLLLILDEIIIGEVNLHKGKVTTMGTIDEVLI